MTGSLVVAVVTDVTARTADGAPQQVHILNIAAVVDVVTRAALDAG